MKRQKAFWAAAKHAGIYEGLTCQIEVSAGQMGDNVAELINREGNKVEFKVAVPAAEVNRTYEQVWAGLSKDVRVPGFRPGKAPRKVIEGRVGRDYIDNQVTERLINNQFQSAVRELKLSLVDFNVIDPPQIAEGKGFEFTVTGEAYPEVTLGDWKTIKLTAEAPEITDEVMERTLADLQERNATFEEVDRAIEASDQVTIEEDGDESGSYPVYLDVAEEHVREALLGKKKDDTLEITVPAKEGEEASKVSVKVLEVKTKKLAELNDEFASSLNFESMERLNKDLKEELERRAQSEGEQARREDFIEQLVAGMTADIPKALLERRREGMMNEIQDDLRRQGVQWREYESFMQEQGKLEEFMTDLNKNAETRVRRELALEKLSEDLEITVSEMEFNQAINSLAQANNIDINRLVSQLGQNGINSYYNNMIRERGLQKALSILSGEDKKEDQSENQTKENTSDTK